MIEKKTILVDAHVHVYDCYDIKKFFEFAISNFRNTSKKLCLTKDLVGILFFTETGETNYFKEFFDNQEYFSRLLNLELEHTSENNTIRIKLDSEDYMVVVAGQQIITSENLEVLALGTSEKLNSKKDLIGTVEMIKNKGAIPVIPWGFGKWFGKRGKMVKEIIQQEFEIFLGDNGGRPSFLQTPALFKLARENKKLVLRGTDPLPIKSQERKVGSFGFYFVSEIDITKPFRDIKGMIYNLEEEPNNFGNLENFLVFLKNQVMIRFYKEKAN